MTGIMVAFVGAFASVVLIIGSSSTTAFLWGFLVCATSVLYGGYSWRRWNPARLDPPPLPVLPSIDKVRLHETLSATVAIDCGNKYRVSCPEFNGRIEISWRLSESEKTRLRKYRERFKLKSGQDVHFSAGFLLVEERLGLALPVRNPGETSDCVLALNDLVANEPFLAEDSDSAFVRRPVNIDYTLRDELKQFLPDLPLVRIVPCLVQQSSRKALEIELQWNNPRQRPGDLQNLASYHNSVEEIEFIEWEVPASWGSVRSATGLVQCGTLEGRARQLVRWEHDGPESGESRHSFAASFEHEIGLDSVIRGRTQLLLSRSISGVETLRMFSPLGRPLSCQTALETRLILDFELNLAGLRTEELRIVPDQKRPQDSAKPRTFTFEGVVPDHLTIIGLLDELTDQHFYVSGAIDNSPSTGSVADVVTRKWELIGRYYDGPPTDFHLVLIGEEVLGAGTPTGTTNVTLTVRGIYTSSRLESQIENTWLKLERLLRETLIARGPAAPIRDAVRADTRAGGRPIRDRNLWRQLNQLREALAEGRISEATYVRATVQIQKELEEREADSSSSHSLN